MSLRMMCEFDDLVAGPAQRGLRISMATAGELAEMHPAIARALGIPIAPLAVTEVIRRVRPDNIWSIWTRNGSVLSGLYAMVMLSAEGLEAVHARAFAARDPDPAHLAAEEAPVAGIYKWTIYAPGRAAAAITLMAERLRRPGYATADLFGAGTTEAGRRIMTKLGFRVLHPGGAAPLYQYVRRPNRLGEQENQTLKGSS